MNKSVSNVRKIALFLFFTSVVSAMVFYIILRAVQIGISLLFIALGSFIFIIIDKEQSELKQGRIFRGIRIDYRVINSLFILVLIISLMTLIISRNSFFRPLSFFICLALMFGIIAIEVVNLNKEEIKKIHIFAVLIKAMAVSFLFKSTFFMGIQFSGIDVIRHFKDASTILSTGSTQTLAYSETPIYHLLWATSSLVTGVDLNSAKFILLIFPLLGIPLMYIFTRVFTGNEKGSLYSALIFSFFTLTNRVRIQTEALVFPVFFLLLFYFLFNSKNKRFEDSLITTTLFTAMAYTHFYYSALFIIWLSLAFLTLILFKSKYPNNLFKDKIRILLPFSTVLWVSKVLYSTNKLNWIVNNFLKIITSLNIITLDIEPTFLSAKLTYSQFLYIHLSELLLVSLTIATILFLLKRMNGKKLLLLVPLIFFTLITFIGIFVEGQKNLAWGVSFRNFYLITLFLVSLGGYSINKLEVITKNQRQNTLIIFVIFFVLSFFSITSQQANNLDPVFYSGAVPSPRFVSYEEIETSYNLLSHLSNDSILLSDQRTLESIYFASSNLHEMKYQVKYFSEPDLPELMGNYDYLIINRNSIERGMIFYDVKKGIAINKNILLNEAEDMNKIWNSGSIQVFYKK